MSDQVAPWINHPLLEPSILAANAPVWDPPPDVVRFLRILGPSVDGLNGWIAEVHKRALCSRCSAPIQWDKKRRTTCSDRCRVARRRAQSSDVKKWIEQDRIHQLIRKLGEIEYADWERQERHQRYLEMLDGSFVPPKRSRLGHAAPRWRGADSEDDEAQGLSFGDMEGVQIHSNTQLLRRHESFTLLEKEAKNVKDDIDGTKWLKEHGFGSDGEPL